MTTTTGVPSPRPCNDCSPGTPLRSSGKLDIVSLAQEAGVKRNKLTHKHTDLKDLFYAQKRTRDGVPDNEIKLREQIAALQKSNQSLRNERDRYRLTSETFARALHVLTIENDQFRRDSRNQPPHPSSRSDIRAWSNTSSLERPQRGKE